MYFLKKDTSTLVAYPPLKEDKIYTIPDETVTVGDEAFCVAMNLEEVVFPDSLKRVENNAFAGCLNLKKIPIEQLEYAGDGAFDLTAVEELTVTKKIETGEENSTFSGMIKLKTLTIEEGVEELNDNFAYSKIESVTIPASVKTIDTDAFCWCFSLKEIKVAEGNKNFVVVDGVLYNKDMTEIIAYPPALEQTVYKVPETIRSSKAYILSKNLKTIVVPKTAEIRTTQHAFGYYVEQFEINSYQDMLEREMIMDNATKFVEGFTVYGYKGTTAEEFYQNNTLYNDTKFITLDDFTGHVYSDWKVTKEPDYENRGIKKRTCLLCDSIEEQWINRLFPESITVGDFNYEVYPKWGYAMVTRYNGSGTDVTIPSEVNGYQVTKLDSGVFSEKAVQTVTIPASITEISNNPFSLSMNLTEIKVAEGNSRYYTTDGVLFDKDTNTLIAYPIGKTDKSYTIPNGIKTIGVEAFSVASNLEKVVFPESLKRVGSHAFYGCYNLKDYSVANLEFADTAAFAFTAIENLTYPKGLKTGEYGAFVYLFKLKTLTIEEGVEALNATEFGMCGMKSVTIPKSVKNIYNGAFAECFNLKEINVAEGNENFVSVDGVLYNKDMTKIVAFPIATDMTIYKIPDTVKELDDNLYGKNIKTVIVPKTVEVGTHKYSFGYYWDAFEITSVDDLINIEEVFFNCIKPVGAFTLYGYKGTTAEEYYNENKDKVDVTFIALDDFTGHIYSDWKVTLKPTQTSTGIKERKCYFCDIVEVKILDKLPLAEVKDTSSGITLSYPDTAFSGNVTLSVTDATGTAAWNVLDNSKKNSLKTMFDIVTLVNGSKVQPNGAVTVKLPLPTGYNPDTTNVYYVTESGTVEKLDSKVENGYIIFETTHFSYYAIVDESSPIVTPEPTPQPEACSCMCHKTGISGFFYKIIRIFWKLFGTNKVCECGAVHY